MGSYNGFLPYAWSLNHFYYDGGFSPIFDEFERRTRIPREAPLHCATLFFIAAYTGAAVWGDATLLCCCGIVIAICVPLPLLLRDIIGYSYSLSYKDFLRGLRAFRMYTRLPGVLQNVYLHSQAQIV